MGNYSSGLVFLGNPGRGKSFLCNLILRRDAFTHAVQCAAVTVDASSATLPEQQIKGVSDVEVCNVPGLLEAGDDPGASNSRFRRNAQQIARAMCGNRLVCFVISAGSGGRLDRTDMVAFKILNRAFGFAADVGFIVNYTPEDADQQYQDDMANEIHHQLADCLSTSTRPKCFFVNHISTSAYRGRVRSGLFSFIESLSWHRCRSLAPIETDAMKQARELREAQERAAELRRMSSQGVSNRCGGFDGGDFDDHSGLAVDALDCRKLRRVRVRCGKYVDAIQLFWDNRDGTQHGGNGGGVHEFTLQNGEYINRVSGRSGGFVDQITFHTTNGRSFGPYGGDGGSAFDERAPAGHSLAWMTGRSGAYIDQLRFWWMQH